MNIYRRKKRLHQSRIKRELSELMTQTTNRLNGALEREGVNAEVVDSKAPDSIGMLVRHTMHAFLYHELEDRFGYRAAGQISVAPLMATINDFNREKDFADKTLTSYYNVTLRPAFMKPVDSPEFKAKFASELERIAGTQHDFDCDRIFVIVQDSFEPVTRYLNSVELDNRSGDK